ncbi:carboxypeptidase-like regulatory domain-containing protein [Alistipes onderdonkii]|uniref:carboxypeptidase-like regulatory domain-containing protein n=1 Tax=Alistipes onderdonkii TaxID=328813 RepID=UPI0034A4C055
MTPNNNFFPLPWYKSVKYQDFRKSYAYGNVFQLIAPDRSLLPFQIRRAHRPEATFTVRILYDDGTQYRNVSADVAADLHVVTGEDFDVIQYCNDGDIGFFQRLAPGRYYAELSDGVETWFSEVFSVVDDLSRYIKLEYWSADNQEYNGGEIDYSNGYRNVLYICSELGKPDYEFEEEAEARDGYPYIEKQVGKKIFRFECKAPEYLVDALRVVWLSDYVRMTANGQLYEVMHFLPDPNWQEDGHYAMVECEVEADTILKKIGVGHANPMGLPIVFRIKAVDAVTGASIPGITLAASFEDSMLVEYYTDASGNVVWNYEQAETVWNTRFAGHQMRIYKKMTDPAMLVDSQGRTLMDSQGRILLVGAQDEDYFDGEVFVDLARYAPSVQDGYDLTLRLIRKSDFVLSPTSVHLPVIGGSRSVEVQPGLFPVKQYAGPDWLRATFSGNTGITLSAAATQYERDGVAEFGPDAYGCLGRRTVAVHQEGTALASRKVRVRLSILNPSGSPVTAAATDIYWTRPDGSTGRNSYRGFDVVDSLIDAATVLSFPLRVTVSEPGFKEYDQSVDIPAGEEDYSYEGEVRLSNAGRSLRLDFSVTDQGGRLLSDAEAVVLYTRSDGEETYYSSKNGRIQTTLADVTTAAFTLGVAAACEGYEPYEHTVSVPEGDAAYSYTDDAVLEAAAPGSRTVYLDLTITDAQGAPVAAQSVEAEYTKSDGTRATYAGSGSKVTATLTDVTTGRFAMSLRVEAEGYEPWSESVTLAAGAGSARVTKTATLNSAVPRRPLKLRLTVTDDQGAPLAADEVTASYILPSGASKLERWADTDAVDVTLEASTEHMTLGLAATKAGYAGGKKQVDIPAGTAEYSVTETLPLTPSEPAPGRNLHVVLSIEDADGNPLAADKVTVTTKNAAGQTVTREYTNTSAVDDTIADIPTSGSSVTVTASKSGYNDGWIQGSIPSGSSDYTYIGVVPLRSSRMISAEVRVQDAGGSAVVAEEIACTYLQSSGKTNTMLATNSSILDDRGHSDCSVKAFTSRITVTAADYNTAVEEVPVEAGTEAVMIRKTVTLYPGSRSLHLDFAVRNEQGAAVEDAVVVIQYVKPDGSDENLQFTGGVHETFDNATTQGFTLLIMAQAEGSRVHMQQIAVPAGKEAYTYDTDVVLYYDYSPGITLDPPSPWTYTAHLGTLRNTGNVDLELLSAPEWCTITGDIPGTVAVGEGRAFAVSKNETGDLRKGTISMQWHNTEASETTAYDVEVSQEP